MKYFLSSLLLALVLLPQVTFAQEATLLPDTSTYNAEACETMMTNLTDASLKEIISTGGNPGPYLGCAIKTGRIRLWMLPYFISYFANFFIGIAATVSLLFVLLGGFWYMTGGLTDDKEKGKKTIFYALIGMVITLLAWIFVNVIQVQITG